MKESVLGLDAATYRSHALHSGDRAWLETNCYVDLWIEVPHALGLDPVPALSFTLGTDFEGDQWLFFKQATGDLYDLHGIDVQELAIFQSLHEHAVQQVAAGRLIVVEVDSFYLPDTRGVSYRIGHTKTTIGIETISLERRELGYFHNAGYFTLNGEDFAALFGLDTVKAPDALAPYTEFAKFDRLRKLSRKELTDLSLTQLGRHLERAPSDNPFTRFAERFRADLPQLTGRGADAFHVYAFATLRQVGSCFELAGSYLRWLEEGGEPGLVSLAEQLESIASTARGLQLRTARAIMFGRPLDIDTPLKAMSESYGAVLGALRARYTR